MMRIMALIVAVLLAISVYEVWVGNWLTFR
jgi:hypothetical protein